MVLVYKVAGIFLTMQYDHAFRVHAGDTDFAGVMYHPNYIDFFDRARLEWFNHLGVDLSVWAREQIFFPVASVTVDYLEPVFYNDEVLVKSQLLTCGRVSLLFLQELWNQNQRCVARAKIKIGCVDHTRRPCLIPSDIKEKLVYA